MRKFSLGFQGMMFLILLVGLSGSAWALMQDSTSSELLKTFDEIVQQVTRLRGIAPQGPIRRGVKSRDEISAFLNENVRENYQESALAREGRMLEKLGFLPPGLNYTDFTIKLLTEQVGGYYDPDKKTFFMAGWLPVEQQKPVMVHELTHALQDQRFDLGRILKEDRDHHNDDRSLAHQAIFEGDAMAVMVDYLLEPVGRNFTQLPDLSFVMRSQYSLMDSQFEMFKRAPMYLKETLVFPYGSGAAFLQKARANNQPWSAVDKIYADLPASTEQILHPEKYLVTRDNPQSVEVENPLPLLGPSWKSEYKNVLGEFSLSLLLRQQIPEEQANRAAAGWGGDQVLLVEENGRNLSAAFVASVWDSPEEASEFFSALGEWFRRRFPRARKVGESPTKYSLIQDGEYHAIERNGNRVRFIVGLPERESAKLKSY